MKIIGVIGPIGSGKDTLAEYLITNHGYKKLSFASRVKDVASVAFGWDRALLEGDTPASRVWREEVDLFWGTTPRQALQKIGTEMFRGHIRDDFWIKIVEQKIQALQEEHVKGIVITDCRFQNEIRLIQNMGGTLVHIQRHEPPSWAEEAILGNPFHSVYNVHITDWNAWAFVKEAQYHIKNSGSLDSLQKVFASMNHVWI